MKKTIYILAVIVIAFLFNTESALQAKTAIYKYTANGTGHWWRSDTYNVAIRNEKTVGGETTINIWCTDPGDNGCASCVVRNGGTGSDPFGEASSQLMEDYVNAQAELGIFSGYASFNTIDASGTSWLRNVTWNGDSTGVSLEMNIVPLEMP